MKAIKLLLLCIGILILFSCKTNQMILKHKPFIINELNSDFIGTWVFVKIIDENGNILDTIWHSQGYYEIANGPVTTFNKDGTYSQQFTSENTYKGKWYYNPASKSMTLFLLINPNTWIGNDLIKNGLAKKYDNGNYYEELQFKITKITNDTLEYIDYSNRYMTYKKIK